MVHTHQGKETHEDYQIYVTSTNAKSVPPTIDIAKERLSFAAQHQKNNGHMFITICEVSMYVQSAQTRIVSNRI